MKVINIAVWGLGRHALIRILPAIKKFNKLSLIGVCSRNEKLVLKVSTDLSCNGWISPDHMLSDKKVDVIFIATPIGVHAEQATQALKAGKHVWCEKPLTCSLDDSKRLVSLAKKYNRMLVESFMYLYHPQFDKVQNYIDDNSNGKIYSLICRFGMPKLNNPGFRNNNGLGGGAFWDIASYPVSAVVALFSSQKANVLFSEIIKKEDSAVDTGGRAILRFSKGALAYLEWGMEVGYKNEIDLWSEKGSFYTDRIFSKPENYKIKYQLRNLKGNSFNEDGEISDQFIDMFQCFFNIYSSSNLIHQEYQSILDRAEVLDQIVKISKLT
jgi:dTDP-3,4-didehydro-2,6-dideoxy-alpha-D-glucose 3-reductase